MVRRYIIYTRHCMCDTEEAHVCGIPVIQGDGVEVDAVITTRLM